MPSIRRLIFLICVILMQPVYATTWKSESYSSVTITYGVYKTTDASLQITTKSVIEVTTNGSTNIN
ncbi:MAG: hypothetical protein ACRC1P_09465 [Cellulosilyticaceae bacterium]